MGICYRAARDLPPEQSASKLVRLEKSSLFEGLNVSEVLGIGSLVVLTI